MKKQQKDAMYHACRIAFCMAEEEIPWQFVLHALRQGLDFRKAKTYTLQKKDYEKYPQLSELIEKLREAKRDKTRGRKKAANQR